MKNFLVPGIVLPLHQQTSFAKVVVLQCSDIIPLHDFQVEQNWHNSYICWVVVYYSGCTVGAVCADFHVPCRALENSAVPYSSIYCSLYYLFYLRETVNWSELLANQNSVSHWALWHSGVGIIFRCWCCLVCLDLGKVDDFLSSISAQLVLYWLYRAQQFKTKETLIKAKKYILSVWEAS